MESNNNTAELVYEIALSRINGIGSVNYKNLINYFGCAENVIKSPKAKITKVVGIGPNALKGLNQLGEMVDEAHKIIDDCQKHQIQIISITSSNYPLSLKTTFDCPPVLYLKGSGKFQENKTIGIVGTRDASDYGKKIVDDLLSQFSGVQVISGMAYGIDIAAHKAALNHNLSTIGVLAHGLEMVYPRTHTKVASEMLEHGLLVSEHPPNVKMLPQFFVSRNRIIAGLSEVVLVVESAKRGGSMITAEYANNYNKDVFAVPGDIGRKQSEGTNQLIFQNKANIFTDAESLIEWMHWNAEQAKPQKPKNIDYTLYSDEESKVLKLLVEKEEMIIDEISWQSQIHLNRLSSILLNLEFMDMIKQTPGKKFSIRK